MKIRHALLVLTAVFLVTGCSQPTSPGIRIIPPQWTVDSGWIEFYTNDPGSYSYAYWLWEDDTNNQFPIEVELRRISGNQGTSFGVLFAHQSDGSFYSAEISLYGSFQILSWDGSDWDAISHNGSGGSWLSSSEINTDYNVINTIEVDYTGTIYSISLNHTEVFSFDRTTVVPDLSGGTAGYISRVGSSGHETFPEIPVEVEFRMIAPAAHP